jgi:hypothetical protein
MAAMQTTPNPASSGISRRHFLGTSLAALAMPAAVRAAVPNPEPAAAIDGFSHYLIGNDAWVRWDRRPIFAYRAHPAQKYPYVYPLIGPLTGLPMTEETGMPYAHHRSLFFACDRINGLDFWHAHAKGGSTISKKLEFSRVEKDFVELTNHCDWTRDDGTVLLRDKRTLVVRHVPRRHTLVDWDIEWEAVAPVTIGKSNHSLFSMRAARDLTPVGGGTLVDADGRNGEKATNGTPSAWCCFYGPRAGLPKEMVEGICLMDHPSNPWAPTPWFTRDYGFASPTPLNFIKKPVAMQPGAPLRFRYRVVVHTGSPAQAGIADLYRQFSA